MLSLLLFRLMGPSFKDVTTIPPLASSVSGASDVNTVADQILIDTVGSAQHVVVVSLWLPGIRVLVMLELLILYLSDLMLALLVLIGLLIHWPDTPWKPILRRDESRLKEKN